MKTKENSKETAKERLHLVLAQDRANVSADFLEIDETRNNRGYKEIHRSR